MNPRTVRELLQHERFLAALARSLLRENGRGERHAEDAVQDTWLVAIKRLESHGQAPRSWLVGVLRNIVRRKLRDDARRLRRETRAARPDAVAGADDEVMSRRLKMTLTRLVQDLPEKYREPILLRFFDGLTPQQIGKRLDLNASTVRTHVQRGLARIRRGLVEGHGGNAHAAVALLAPLSRRNVRRRLAVAAIAASVALVSVLGLGPVARAVGLAPSEAVVRASTASTRTADNGSRSGLEGRTAISAAAVLRGRVEAPPGTVRLTLVDAAQRAVARDVAPGEPFTVPVGGMHLPLTVAAAHPETAPRTVVLRELAPVLIQLHRRPSAVAELSGTAARGSSADAGADRRGRAGEASGSDGSGPLDGEEAGLVLEGVVRFPPGIGGAATVVVVEEQDLMFDVRDRRAFRVPLKKSISGRDRITVYVAHAQTLSETLTLRVLQDESGRPSVTKIDLDLIAARAVSGRVTRADGLDLGLHQVLIYRGDASGPLGAPRMRTVTDDEGRFEVRAEGPGRYWAVAHGSGARPGAVAFDLVDGEELPELQVLLPMGASLSGKVRLGDGAMAAGAQVVIRRNAAVGRRVPVSPGQVLVFGEHGPEWLERTTESSFLFGAYAFDGLGSVPYRVELRSVPGADAGLVRALALRRAVVPPATADFELDAALFAFRVRAGAGARVSLQRAGAGGVLAIALDESGAGRLDVVPGARYTATFTAPGFLPHSEELTAPLAGKLDVERELQPAPATASLRVRLVPRAAAPVPASALLELRDERGAIVLTRTVRASSGVFALDDVAPGAYRLTVYPGGLPETSLGGYLPARAPVELAADTTTALTLPVEPGARLSLRVVAPEGGGAAFTAWVETLAHERTDLSFSRESGRRADRMLTRELLPAGGYVVWIQPDDPDLAPAFRRVSVPAGRTLDLEFTLEPR